MRRRRGVAAAGLMLSALFAGSLPAGEAHSKNEAPMDQLADMRTLAGLLQKDGLRKDTSVVLEYRVDRQGNACTGDRPEIGLKLRRNGHLELLVTRSWSETDRSGPGAFQGKLDAKQWDSAFARIAKMRWVEDPMMLPMPGISESSYQLAVFANGKEARYSLSGAVPPTQGLVADGLDAAADLAQKAKADTLWSLGLLARAQGAKGEVLKVQAEWKLQGKQALRIQAPSAEASPACGSAELRWFADLPAKKGETPLPPEIHRAAPARAPAGAGAWKDIKPGESLALELEFRLPKTKAKARKGKLTHLGIPVALPGGQEPFALVTLFSGDFAF